MWHFNTKKFRPNELKRVKISLACVCAFMAVGWPLIVFQTGIIGWIKFWLMPWLGYHFWVCIASLSVSNAFSSLSISTASVHTNDKYKLMDCLVLQVIKIIAMTVSNISGYMGYCFCFCSSCQKGYDKQEKTEYMACCFDSCCRNNEELKTKSLGIRKSESCLGIGKLEFDLAYNSVSNLVIQRWLLTRTRMLDDVTNGDSRNSRAWCHS